MKFALPALLLLVLSLQEVLVLLVHCVQVLVLLVVHKIYQFEATEARRSFYFYFN